MVSNVILAVGVLLVTALIGAFIADRIRVPKVTPYLLIGLAVGPHRLRWMSGSLMEPLDTQADWQASGNGLIAGKRLVVLLIGGIALTLSASEVLQLPYLLVFLAMGVTVANTPQETQAITKELTQHKLAGVIRYEAISGTTFDPHSSDLVCADDLAEPAGYSIRSTDAVEAIVEVFDKISDVYGVITNEDEQFVGVIRRSQVMNLLVRGHRSQLRQRSEFESVSPVTGVAVERRNAHAN